MRARRPAFAARLCALALAAVPLASCAPEPVRGQGQVYRSDHHAYRVVTVVDGLEHPWGLAFLPGGDMLVTERPGRVRVVRDGVLDPQPVAGVPAVAASGQGGLLDVELHPDFERNRLVYLSYSKPGERGATTAVIRGRLEGGRLSGVEEVIETRAWGRRGAHFGSRLVFDGAGRLFITIGERGEMQRAQDLRDHAGTTLRLHDDGRVPADNPFVGRPDALPEIWTYGNRSPQGLALHPVTGELWQVEHGPRGGDEINLLRPGRNYGWPVITYGINYNGRPISDLTHKDGMEQPLLHWTPSIAASGMAIYNGDRFPAWRGHVFVAALAGQHLARVAFDGHRPAEQERLLGELGRRLRHVKEGPDGYLYILVDDSRAPVLRLEPADSPS